MAAAHEFTISGDHAAGINVVRQVIENQGFSVVTLPEGGWKIERGSFAMTLMLGALAGTKFHVSFDVVIATAADGTLLVRMMRNKGRSAVKGGAMGLIKANETFEELANVVHAGLQQAGVLVNSVAIE